MNTAPETAAYPALDTAAISSPGARRRYLAIIAVLFCLIVWPVIFFSVDGRCDDTGAVGDQDLYHYPVILKMAKAWPHPDLRDMGGAIMTPTFHLTMAAFVHYGGANLRELRFINSFTGLFLILTVFWYTSKCTDAKTAFGLSLVYLFSPFMLSCAMWLMTADFAFIFVVISLACAALFPPRPGRVLGSGLAAAAATAIRQVHLWLAAPVGTIALCELVRGRFPWLMPPKAPKEPRLPGLFLISVIAAIVPFLALLFFVWLWGGLMPPDSTLRGMHNHFTIIPVAMVQAAYCGVFLAPAVLDGPLSRYLRDWRIWAGAIFCTVLTALPRSGVPSGPSGMLNSLAARTPVIFHRLPVLLPPAALAGAVLAAFLITAINRGRGRAAVIILVGFWAWLAAQTATPYALRGYCDIIFVMEIWLAALCLPPGPRQPRFWLCTGALAAVQLLSVISQIFAPVFWRH